MKKLIILILAAVTLLAIAFPAWAAGDIKIVIDGKELVFGNGEQGPIMENGRVLVPLRRLFEEIECQVHYLPEGQRIHIYSFPLAISINMRVDVTDAYVFNKVINLDVAPKLFNSTTLIPLRFVAENAHCKVLWDAKNRRVNITRQPLLSVDEYSRQELPLEYYDGKVVFARASAAGMSELYGTSEFSTMTSFSYNATDNNTLSLLLDQDICTKIMPQFQQTLIKAAHYYQSPVTLTVCFDDYSPDGIAKLEQIETYFETFPTTFGTYYFKFLHMQYSPYTKNFHSQWYYQSELTVEIIK
ncbi:MAG: copper amine oxidase N-terminal domain-containing protein [Clostridiales bacterium]|nr:copper amine oxidase N-terminal domain-containing protein [Clostridiales bacterium]